MGAGGSGEMTRGDDGSVERARATPDAVESGNPASVPCGRNWMVLGKIYAFSAAFALAAAALWVKGPFLSEGPVRHLINQPEMFVVVCVLTGAAVWQPVVLHYRGNSYLFILEEVPLLLGLVFLSPRLFILGSVLTEAFVFVFLSKKALIKVVYNMTSGLLLTALTVIVFRELLGRHSPISIQGWGSLAVAGCFLAATTTVVVKLVMKLNGQTTERRTPLQFTTEAMLMAASICLSFVVLDAAWFSLWATLPLLLVGVLITLAYRGYSRLLLRFGSLQRLYDFSRILSTASLEPSSMSLDVLEQVRTVMRARRAELILAEPSGIPRRISVGDGGASGVEPIALDQSVLRDEGDCDGRRLPPQQHRKGWQPQQRPNRRRIQSMRSLPRS